MKHSVSPLHLYLCQGEMVLELLQILLKYLYALEHDWGLHQRTPCAVQRTSET